MRLEERCALVPREETERERKTVYCHLYPELIADDEKELEAKRQALHTRCPWQDEADRNTDLKSCQAIVR